MGNKNKTRHQSSKTVRSKASDKGEVLVNEGGGDATLVGSSWGNGDSGIPMLITASAKPSEESQKRGPKSSRRDKNNERFNCVYHNNKKGGMTYDMMVPFIRECVLPPFDDRIPTNPVFMLLDGQGSHSALELVDY